VRYLGVVPLALVVAGAVIDACANHSSAPNQGRLVPVVVCDTVPPPHAGSHARVPPVTTPTATGTLAGSVDEHLTNLAVAGASVRIRGDASRDVNSDSTGGFVVEALKPGRYSVLVIHMGYDPDQDSIQVTVGEVVMRQYHLRYRACPL
jgi:hypothetical protein